MQRVLLKSKIHRARVTEANLDYEGSLTIDEELMRAADILPYEQVKIFNVSNGERFETYAITGPPGSGVFCLNGAAARKGARGDIIIIVTYGVYDESDDLREHEPKVVLLGPDNKPTRMPMEVVK